MAPCIVSKRFGSRAVLGVPTRRESVLFFYGTMLSCIYQTYVYPWIFLHVHVPTRVSALVVEVPGKGRCPLVDESAARLPTLRERFDYFWLHSCISQPVCSQAFFLPLRVPSRASALIVTVQGKYMCPFVLDLSATVLSVSLVFFCKEKLKGFHRRRWFLGPIFCLRVN